MTVIMKERENGRLRVMLDTGQESRVEQHHKDSVNVNKIIAKYRKTGLFPHRTDVPRYGDFSSVDDFHGAQNRIRQAEEDFLKLPAEIRKRFDNDPGELVEFVNDPQNAEEAIRLGLLPNPENAAPAEPQRPKPPVETPVEPAGNPTE